MATAQDAVMVTELMMQQDATVALAETELQKVAKELSDTVKAENINMQVSVGDPRECILQAAETYGADLIVMGSHGRTGLTKFFIGSVSQAVAVHAPNSVVIIRGVVPKGKMGQLNQSGLFVAENNEELQKKYAEIKKNAESQP
jgi:nucleotide-binding universal stress UspA family protein